MKVYILAGCLNSSRISYSTLVFRSLRIGFPTADVEVLINLPMPTEDSDAIEKAALNCGCKVTHVTDLKHHEYVEKLVIGQSDPFWIVDTDVIFYASVEEWDMRECYLAGALIPEFEDQFTKAITRSRLHTSLMYVNPEKAYKLATSYITRHPDTIYNPGANLFYPLYMPYNGKSIFYDTAAMLYHAIGGTPFTPHQLDHYFHFHFGTCADSVLPHLQNAAVIENRRAEVMKDPSLGIGKWREQMEYFEMLAPKWDGKDVIAKITDDNAVSAREWCVALCNGNQEAMTFCDIWYRYCHAIDDLVDTVVDGRPTMSKDQMISIFFTAALLYNCSFYVKNRDLLSPIVLLVTNTYRDSVAWENSSKSHLRAMGDVFRTCGNEMYVMVALLCGGEDHMRKMSMAIKERDWLGQHDDTGRPM